MPKGEKKTFTLNPSILWADFKDALQMFWAVIRGKYPAPIKSIVWTVLGMLYFVVPIDTLPEAVFMIIGYGDDLLVIAYVLNKIRPDIEAYREFVRQQKKVIKNEKDI